MKTCTVLHRLLAYLLPAGALLCVCSGLPAHRVFADEAAAAGSVVISEVMWMGSDVSTSDEWVEIVCTGVGDCDLSGWTLTSSKSTGEEAVIHTFQTGAMLPAGDVRVVSNYPAASSRLLSEPWITTPSMSLPNTKLLLRLYDADGVVRDEVDDGVGSPFAGANVSGLPKASMERIDLAVPGNIAENWQTATLSLGFKEGAPIFGTPGFLRDSSPPLASSASSAFSVSSSSSTGSSLGSVQSSSGSGSFVSSVSSASSLSSISFLSSSSSISSSIPSVFITEVLANPIGADTEEWIEIANLGAVSVNIAGWTLDDGNSSAVYTILPQSGSGFFLAPGEYWSFRKSVTSLPLDNNGERVSLMNGSQLIDAWEYPMTAEEVSFGRDKDPPYALHAFCVPSEGQPNVVASLAPRILIQDAGSASVGSAFVVGEEHVSINLQAAAGAGSLASAVCTWDYGDDAVSSACNPPSHTFSDPGDYTVRLTVRDFCGGISVSTLNVTVLPKEQPQSSSSKSSASSSSLSSFSSVSSSSSISFTSSISSFSSSASALVETGAVLSEVMMTGDEWIELFNSTDHEISLAGWILDDLREGGLAHRSSARSGGGSKPFIIPSSTTIAAGAYRIFSRDDTKLALNDTGDDVWLIAPDNSWSDHVTIPKLKAGTSLSFCNGEWRTSDPTPGLPNTCQTTLPLPVSSIASAKKSVAAAAPAFSRTRYVSASRSSISSLSFPSSVSGSLLMTFVETELPDSLTVTGEDRQQSSIPEMGVLGVLSSVGVSLLWLKRRL
ncbi:MAG: lamin tail domain-containing protein [Candidatus Peregrinibacteria bacterium]